MTFAEELGRAIILQQKAYKLLLWVQGAMDSGWLAPENAHRNMTAPQITKTWLLTHYLNLPSDVRPNRDNPADVDVFCNLFSAFLLTSFDIATNPGQKLGNPPYCCSMCSYMIPASHLRPKKLSKKDKTRAEKLKVSALKQLCLDEALDWRDGLPEALAAISETWEAVAIVAYSYELVRRSKGTIEGSALLALWRNFAWNENGSPKKKFHFEIETVWTARVAVLECIRNSDAG